jgi:hypothetical protein
MVFPVRPSILTSIHRLANVAPLTAALIAPLAVLLDIPALTVRIYSVVWTLVIVLTYIY